MVHRNSKNGNNNFANKNGNGNFANKNGSNGHGVKDFKNGNGQFNKNKQPFDNKKPAISAAMTKKPQGKPQQKKEESEDDEDEDDGMFRIFFK